MTAPSGVITLLTDFGLTDPFVPAPRQTVDRSAGLIHLANLSGVVFNDEDAEVPRAV